MDEGFRDIARAEIADSRKVFELQMKIIVSGIVESPRYRQLTGQEIGESLRKEVGEWTT